MFRHLASLVLLASLVALAAGSSDSGTGGEQLLKVERSDPAEREAHKRKWEEFDRRMKARFTDYRNDMDAIVRQRSIENSRRGIIGRSNIIRLYFKTSPGCHVSVAVHYEALDGQWVTFGWMRATSDPDATVEDMDYLTIDSTGSTVWVYARITKGRLVEYRHSPESILELPIIPERNFIRRGDEDLNGPGLEVVPFIKKEGIGQSAFSRTITFGCHL